MILQKYGRAGLAVLVACNVAAGNAYGRDGEIPGGSGETDSKPLLYVVSTAHLDTQWLWTIQDSINEYIPNTLRDNFALFEQFPHYTFSFEGAFRYMLAKEYYPDDYRKLKQYVADGRWHVCGSSIDGGDVNVPSPESLIRHILYGNDFFKREFGKTSTDIFLPDCFGFGYALPSIAAHCGLNGFSTQKLTWGSSVGIPFDVGFWKGIDGTGVIAALNPGEYVSTLRNDLSWDQEWLDRINATGKQSGSYVGYKYVGVGDVGGAPDEETVQWLEKSISSDGPIRVINTAANQLYLDLTPEQAAKLPQFDGELLMTRHGTGCYTSQAAMKRWNRQNELLADAAERASVAADWLGAAKYPRQLLKDAWIRFLWHHMHDDLPGTCIPQAYTFSWNDEIISLNRFAGVLTDAVAAFSSAMDTRAHGVPVVVFNPVAAARKDVVAVRLQSRAFDRANALRVFGPDGQEVPSQFRRISPFEVDVLFSANVPATGFAAYDVRPTPIGYAETTDLITAGNVLENNHYRVSVNADGDIASILDKRTGREVLEAPVSLQIFQNTPDYWSEWEIRYQDIMDKPIAVVGAAADVRLAEKGPVRSSIKITRQALGSTVIQFVRLASGEAGDSIVVDNLVDWRTPKTLLKASFPFTAYHSQATYDLGFGAIERTTNTKEKYEVPAQQWASLTDTSGQFGVSILNDCKYGWDKPDDHTLRLSLIHLPNNVEKDMGWHRFTYAIAPQVGDWRENDTVQKAARLNQPLMGFQTTIHDGEIGKKFSLLKPETEQVVVRAVKKALQGEELIVRVQEAWGRSGTALRLTFGVPVTAAREVNGMEQPVGDATVDGKSLVFDLSPFQPRTFAVVLKAPAPMRKPPKTRSVPLAFDTDVVSFDGNMADGDFDGQGHTLPGELLPETIEHRRVPFDMGPPADGMKNAVTCRGQKVELPEGTYQSLHILAATTGQRLPATFHVGTTPIQLSMRGFSGWIGQSDSLISDGKMLDGQSMAPAFIDRDDIAWVGTHRHDAGTGKNEPYTFCYLFSYPLPIPAGATSVELPNNEAIRILAMTVSSEFSHPVLAGRPLYDDIQAVNIQPQGGLYIEPVTVTLSSTQSNTEIFFTVDGTDPTQGSRRYSEPFRVLDTVQLRARAFVRGEPQDTYAAADFTFTSPREAVDPGEVEPGLRFDYFEGEWRKVPDFTGLVPAKTGVVEKVELSPRNRDEQYAFSFEGFLQVPRNGVYTFFTASDDGSLLFVDETLIVDNDGLHGRIEKSGKIALARGYHPLRITYFERTGDDNLTVSCQGPLIPKEEIPPRALFHAKQSQSP